MLASWAEIVAAVCILQLGWLIYGVVYRLFLSPLAKLPGPKLAALTSWYEFYFDVIQPGKFVWKIKDLHEQYGTCVTPTPLFDCRYSHPGPIIRVTPWEVHINDVEFLDDIYAPSHRRREKYAFQLRTLPVPLSIGGSRTHDLHRRRREALNPFFSRNSVMSLESSINEKVEQLCRLMEDHQKENTPVNLSDVYYGFALE